MGMRSPCTDLIFYGCVFYIARIEVLTAVLVKYKCQLVNSYHSAFIFRVKQLSVLGLIDPEGVGTTII